MSTTAREALFETNSAAATGAGGGGGGGGGTLTPAVSQALSFAVFKSPAVETEAQLIEVGPAADPTATVTEKPADSDGARTPACVARTTPLVEPTLHPDPCPETNVSP